MDINKIKELQCRTLLLLKKIITEQDLQRLKARGAILRVKASNAARADLNRATPEQMSTFGLSQQTIEKILAQRPYLSWTEIEDYLMPLSTEWPIFRQRFFLGLSSG